MIEARHATTADMRHIMAMLKRHHEEEGFAWPFEAVKLSVSVQRAMSHPHQCVLVCDGGLLMAACADSPLTPFRIAYETIIRAEKKGACEALLAAYESWARSVGCDRVRVASIKKHYAFGRLWNRFGYSICETTFEKVL